MDGQVADYSYTYLKPGSLNRVFSSMLNLNACSCACFL